MAEDGLLQVIREANARAYGDGLGGIQVAGCFLCRPAKRGVDDDGEEVIYDYAGMLAPHVYAFVFTARKRGGCRLEGSGMGWETDGREVRRGPGVSEEGQRYCGRLRAMGPKPIRAPL